jgi:hypothetical protein
MKSAVALGLAGVLVMALSLQAQNYDMAKQQARRASAANDAEQARVQREAAGGGTGAPAHGAPAVPSAAPMDPVLQATLKNVTSLQGDFTSLTVASDPSDPGLKVALLNDLTQAAQGTKASADSVKKVTDDLHKALAGNKKIPPTQMTKLAQYVHALFNGAHLNSTQQETLLNRVQKLLTDGGVSLDDAVNTVTDLKVVVGETK